MTRQIVCSPLMLRVPSEPADEGDRALGQDLLDTLAAHAHECVGMAANMVGVRKRVIVVADGPRTWLMYNPRIIEKSGAYEAEEGCLSLAGTRAATRYRRIKVSYLDESWTPRTRSFSGYVAQIIQHEVDHCDGILI